MSAISRAIFVRLFVVVVSDSARTCQYSFAASTSPLITHVHAGPSVCPHLLPYNSGASAATARHRANSDQDGYIAPTTSRYACSYLLRFAFSARAAARLSVIFLFLFFRAARWRYAQFTPTTVAFRRVVRVTLILNGLVSEFSSATVCGQSVDDVLSLLHGSQVVGVSQTLRR